jgi:group I intron endonuclease
MLIYEAYNKQNGTSYIGLTTKTLDHRKSQHIRSAKSNSQSHFHKALRKYGESSFEWSVVFLCSSLEDLHKKEKVAISLYEPWQLYNKSLGGEHSAFGMKHSESTKQLCREASLNRWYGKRASDVWPDWLFNLCSYKVAKKFGVPKTTWYRERKLRCLNSTHSSTT